MNQQAIIFDRDNTLTRIDPAIRIARAGQISTITGTLPENAAMMHWRAWTGPWPRCRHEEPDFWWAFWSSLAPRYGLSITTVHALQAQCLGYHRQYAAFPDALSTIRTLRARGWRLAVLTNFQLPSVDLTLRNAGIDPHWFAALLSCGMLGASKPDPRPYLAAAAALDLPPGACVFVDDLLENVAGACEVGMRSIWLDREQRDIQTRFERITDLCQLVDLIAGAGGYTPAYHVSEA